MDMVRRGCFGAAAVVFFLGAIRLLIAHGDLSNEIHGSSQAITQEFELIGVLIDCGVTPIMIAAGVFCIAMTIPARSIHHTIELVGDQDRRGVVLDNSGWRN